MAEWGLWDDEVDAELLLVLSRSYMRRKRWESKVLAEGFGALVGGGSVGDYSSGRGRYTGRVKKKVRAGEFLKMTGVKIQ